MTSIQPLRFVRRTLKRSPGANLLAILTLGLGIGLTAVMYSMVRGVVLRGLPFEDAGELAYVAATHPQRGQDDPRFTRHDFADFKAQQTSFEGLAAFAVQSVNLGDESGFPERYLAGAVSPGSFALLGVEPVLGRDLTPEDAEPGAPAVVLLGHGLWRARFREDRGILGRTLRVDGVAKTVVGVMPPEFRFPEHQDLWTPLSLDLARAERGEDATLSVFGRLSDGTDLAAARAEFATIAARLAEAYPESNQGRGVTLKPYQEQYIGPDLAGLLYAMLVAVSLVLLIACANVASLLLARASTQAKELAIRTALGARRSRLILRMLFEGVVLSSFGAVLGLLIAHLGVFAINRSMSWMASIPFWIRIAVDWPVLGFVVLATVSAGVLSAVLPALKSSRADVNTVLKDQARGNASLRMGRVTRVLVIGEIALSFALLVATALLVQSVRNVDKGSAKSDPDETVLTARINLPAESYPEASDRIAFFERLSDQILPLPGVDSVALTPYSPGIQMGGTHYAVEGRAYAGRDVYPWTAMQTVTPPYFKTFEIPLLQGRLFTEQDTADAPPVVIVNQSLAAEIWGTEDGVGRRLRFGQGDGGEPWRTVVGVVPDAGVTNVTFPSQAGLYVPYAQNALDAMTVAIRIQAPAEEIAGALRARVLGLDRNLPVYNVRTEARVVWERSFVMRLVTSLFSAFGLAALVLAGVGIYGVTSFSVGQRTQEIGVRMAFGANRREVLGLVLGQGMGRVAIGLAAGLGLAYLLASSLTVMFFQVEPGDPFSFALTAAVLAGVTFAACLVPAWKASRVDPMTALRCD